MRRLLGLIALLTVTPIHAGTLSVSHLKNGLTVIIKEDHRAPMVLTQAWYRVGSANEVNGHTGLSHVLEHSLFFATKHIPHKQMKAYVGQRGGSENAFTTQDATVFYSLLPKAYLSDALYLESERMSQAIFPKNLFDNELKVIAEERRLRIDDNPQAKGFEYFSALAHLRSPYHHPVIGWASDIAHTTREDAIHWYQTWYAPNNAILLVMGDIDKAATLKMIQHHFGSIAKKTMPHIAPKPTLPPMGSRYLSFHANAKTPFIIYGFTVPTTASAKAPWEPYALRVLAAVLSEGHGARLDQQLQYHDQLVTSVGIGYPMLQRYDSTLSIYLVPTSRADQRLLIDHTQRVINQLKHALIPLRELARAQAQIIAEDTYQRDGFAEEAIALGTRATIGIPLEEANAFAEHIQAVTPEQIAEVARTYLTEHNRTIVSFIPKPGGAS